MTISTRLRFTTTTAALVTVAAVAGCSAPSEAQSGTQPSGVSTTSPRVSICLGDHDGLVIVAAVHANAPRADTSHYRCAIGQALAANRAVSAVSVEGTPNVLVHAAKVSSGANSEANFNARVTAKRVQVEEQITGFSPAGAGADLVSALAMGMDEARAAGMRHPLVVVDDPGLTDRGAVTMTTSGMLTADAGEVAAQVKSARQCPTFTGADVTLVGLGYGIAPQQLLTPADRDTVTQIWSTLVTQCGGKPTVVPFPATGTGPTTQFTVTPVLPSTYGTPTLNASVTYPGNSPLGFVADTTTFAHPTQARNVLSDIAAQMKANPSWHLTVTGTTANGPTKWPSLNDLGQGRANTVAAELATLGVTRSRITAIGHGYTAHPPQVDAATAALNRSTTFTYTDGQ